MPGSSKVAVLRGKATLTTDLAARGDFVVHDRMPLLAIEVETDRIVLRDSAALARANLWPVTTAPAIDPAKLFVEHIKLNRSGGIGASLAKAALSIPGASELLRKGLEKDYKENLY